MESKVKVILKSGKDQSVRKFHPWILSGAIKKMSGEPQEGDLVEVYDNKEELLSVGHVQMGTIAIRNLTFTNETIDYDFYYSRVKKAFELRKAFGLHNENDNNTYRLVHAEGDNLPGLIIDYYNGTAVLQFNSVGMFREINTFSDILQKIYGEDLKAIYNKSANTLPFKEDKEKIDGYVWGENQVDFALEYGNKFKVNWAEGQKTGFFIDQRENRKLLMDFAKGRKVLNMFGYTGGFSVYAMRGGAELVHTVDASGKAIDLTRENISLNFEDTSSHEAYAKDAFEYLENVKDQYDLIILDPPAFAKHHKMIHNALKGYERLNQKAIEQVQSGGILFTFSCSQVVSKDNFKKTIASAAARAGRNVRILHQLSQPIDHPINVCHPEGEYLKGLILMVD